MHERVELFCVDLAGVAEAQAPAGSIGPFGAHFLPVDFRGELRLPADQLEGFVAAWTANETTTDSNLQ